MTLLAKPHSLLAALIGVAFVAVTAIASAQTVGGTAEAESRAVIEKQLDAFQRDAWSEAFGYASPGIQRMFRNPQRFSEMVRGGYPMVWRPSDVEFLGASPEGPYLLQRLRIVDQAGAAYIARYQMTLVDGVWRIAGVSIERAPEAGA